MKYSLRSLMIVVTLFCVGLGCLMARVEYLRRWATFHRNETDLCRLEMRRREKILLERIEKLSDNFTPMTSDVAAKRQSEKDAAYADYELGIAAFKLHRDLESKYSRAVYRPWMLVSESAP